MLKKLFPFAVKRAESNAVWVLRGGFRREHLVAVKKKIIRLNERDLVLPHERERLRITDLKDDALDGGGIDRARLLAREPKENGAVCSMAHAGKRERSIQIDVNAADAPKDV